MPRPSSRPGEGRAGGRRKGAALLAAGLLAGGCATTVTELRRHPEQQRLETILAQVLPHTSYPDLHYWVRVSEPLKHPVGLCVLPQRHIYLSEALLKEADETIVRSLLVHGVAHHRLHHHGQRSLFKLAQWAVFKVAGAFVPGVGYGRHVSDPLLEVPLSAGQERQADTKTVTYLARMGRPPEDFVRALEFLAERGYAERVGRVTSRREAFRNRIERLRRHAKVGS